MTTKAKAKTKPFKQTDQHSLEQVMERLRQAPLSVGDEVFGMRIEAVQMREAVTGQITNRGAKNIAYIVRLTCCGKLKGQTLSHLSMMNRAVMKRGPVLCQACLAAAARRVHVERAAIKRAVIEIAEPPPPPPASQITAYAKLLALHFGLVFRELRREEAV